MLAPNWTDFDETSKRVHYIAYEMIDCLRSGENAIGVMLGNGFYNQTERTIEGHMRYDSPRFLFQLKIENEDGSQEWIVSDDSWSCSQGLITSNNMFLGETYDAGLEQVGWDFPGFYSSMWVQAQPVRKPTGRLVSQLSPAVIGLMIQIADVLGRTEDRDHYRQMLKGTISAFNEEFLDRNKACYSIGRQGAEVFPFVLGCVPVELEARVWARLLQHYQVDLAGHLDTGIFGTAFLFDLLSNRGETDTALTILSKRDYPSYRFMIEQGATTLWERWDELESHNLPMFGSVSAWFYRVVAGLAPHRDAVAFDKAELRQFCSNKLDYAKASVHTIQRQYSIHWSRTENGGGVKVAIPSNSSAELYFPIEKVGAAVNEVKGSGTMNPLSEPGEVRRFLQDNQIPNGDIYLKEGLLYINLVKPTERGVRLLADSYR